MNIEVEKFKKKQLDDENIKKKQETDRNKCKNEFEKDKENIRKDRIKGAKNKIIKLIINKYAKEFESETGHKSNLTNSLINFVINFTNDFMQYSKNFTISFEKNSKQNNRRI